ncbi:hypothetical protein [Mycobacterium sp.]|uniref:hypothetical protein n=1 Tax=Mycobacterium sp. TaxID=1785 RepID=UPI002D912074|nr:hypothetical protein [Mycobacterium sp.]
MGSFGNNIGAKLSPGRGDNSGSVFDEAWVTNSNYPERQVLLADPDNLESRELRDLSANIADQQESDKYVPNSILLDEVPGLLSDHTTNQEVNDTLTGPDALNWESRTFRELRRESDTLKPGQLGILRTAWEDHGNTLKTESEDFKEAVRNVISGKWSGASADAAEAATQQVTKTSIYDFTPSSDEIGDRLSVLKAAFEHVKYGFPNDANDDLIDSGDFDKEKLDQRVNEFNNKYHLDGDGRLRNNSDGYVSAQDAVDEMNRIQRSIDAYRTAVLLFRDTYNPTVQAVTDNFPNLPAPPNMQYGPTGPGPTGPGPTGPGPTGPGPTGPGPTNPGTPPFNTPKFDTPPTTSLDTGKTPAISDYQLGTGDQTPISNPQNWPTTNPSQTTAQGLKSGLDAATQGMKSGLDAASQAAQKAAQQAAGAGQKPIPSLREGALGLGDKAGGPKGLGGGAAGGGSAGAGGTGGLPAHQPAARLSTESASGARPAVPAASTSGMGAMGGMGAPGMGGGPAAGGRGADGKEHKGNKALRTRKNGSDIVGDTDAVVPVLGDSPPPAEETQQPAPPHRRIPGQRGTSWQPDSAVQSSPRRSPQAQDPSSAVSE